MSENIQGKEEKKKNQLKLMHNNWSWSVYTIALLGKINSILIRFWILGLLYPLSSSPIRAKFVHARVVPWCTNVTVANEGRNTCKFHRIFDFNIMRWRHLTAHWHKVEHRCTSTLLQIFSMQRYYKITIRYETKCLLCAKKLGRWPASSAGLNHKQKKWANVN